MKKDDFMNEDLMHFKKLLKKNGYEFTSQKQIILRTIMNFKTHLNAKEIYGKEKKV
jgi:Fur family ferric uptake transcriptional regulator